jgi:hypothetical protein
MISKKKRYFFAVGMAVVSSLSLSRALMDTNGYTDPSVLSKVDEPSGQAVMTDDAHVAAAQQSRPATFASAFPPVVQETEEEEVLEAEEEVLEAEEEVSEAVEELPENLDKTESYDGALRDFVSDDETIKSTNRAFKRHDEKKQKQMMHWHWHRS